MSGSEQRQLAAQLEALSRVSSRLGSTLLLDDVLKLVLQEAVANSSAYDGEILFFAGSRRKNKGFVFQGPVIATPNLDQRAIEGKSALADSLVASEKEAGVPHWILLAPILFETRVSGLLRLFSNRVDGFTENDVTFATALCNHAALAVGNSRRFSELRERNTLLQRRTQQIEHFLESSRVFHSERRLEELYEELVYAIQEGVGFNVVLLSLVDEISQGMMLRRVTAAGLPLDRLKELQKTQQTWGAIEQVLSDDFRLGGAYFVPRGMGTTERRNLDIHQVSDLYPVTSTREVTLTDREPWSESDLFFIPLRDSQGKPQGLISLTAPIDGLRPDLNTARALEVFANQAASAIENVQLFHNMWDYALQLQQLHNVSQQTLRERDFGRQLEFILEGLQIAGWQRVTLTLRDESFNVTKLVSAGLSEEERQILEKNLLPAPLWRQRFSHDTFQQYRRGNCFFLPHDDVLRRADGDVRTRTDFDSIFPAAPQPLADRNWDPGGVLYRPLYDREQRFIGLLALSAPESGYHSDENGLQTIDLYAQFAISVLESHRLFSEMQQRSQELQALFDASRALSGTLKQDAILTAMGEHMLQAVRANAYNVYALTRDRLDTVVLRSELRPTTLSEQPVGVQSPLEQMQLAQEVIQTGRAATLGHARDDVSPIAMLPIPLRNELFGLVEVVAFDAHFKWTSGKLQLLEAIANQAGTALETAHVVEDLDERVAQRTRALAEEVARIQSILESIADGVLVAEADGTILMANMPTARFLNTPREQLVGKAVESLIGRFGPGSDRWANAVGTWSSQTESIEPHSAVKDQFEIGNRVVSVHISPVLANEQFFGTISIFRDMTREAEVDRMKSEFVSNVSHELRTPMTSIKGYTDLLLMGAAGSPSESQFRFLDAIRRNTDRLKVLVDDLLEISRIETGTTDLERQSVDLAPIVQNEIDVHVQGRLQHERKALVVRYNLEAALPPVYADPEKVTRIIMNLVDNAINYTPDGGTIEVSARSAGATDRETNSVRVSVRDSGPGISAEYRDRIFERFYRVEEGNIQETPGTGLGLSIVRSLVEMHGGEISVESEVGVGSTFHFSLPCFHSEPLGHLAQGKKFQ